MKHLKIVPRGTTLLANGEAATAGDACQMQNLREVEDALQVTGVPATVGAVGAGERLLLINDGGVVSCDGDGNIVVDGVTVTVVEGDVVGAYGIGSLLVVVTSAGLVHLTQCDGEWTVLDADDVKPQLTFTADTATSSATIAAYTFDEPYSQWSAPLADADTTALARRLRAAWDGVTADIAALGRHSAPMLVRWAVRLVDDTYLWMSEAVRVGDETLSNTDRITAAVTVDSDAGFTGTTATALSMTHYALGIGVTGGIGKAWLPLVKSIDVFATTQATLVNGGNTLDYRCVTSTTGERSPALQMGLTARSAAAIASQLAASGWTLVATAAASEDMSEAQFVSPVTAVTLTGAQCDAIGSSMCFTGTVVAATAAGGRLYCCTSSGQVVVTVAGNALVEAHRSTVLGASPLAMAAVTRPLYSGGFGRYPVYVFTDDGIFAIPQTTAGTLGEARLVDRTIISQAVAPVEAGRDIWFISRHGHLCQLAGSAVTVARRDTPATALAWCNAHQELWMLMADGYPMVRMASGRTSTRTVLAAQLFSDPRHAVAVTAAGGVVDLEQEEAAADVPVTWLTHPVALHPLLGQVVQRLVWHVTSSGAALSLDVVGQRGIMASDTVMSRVVVDGDVDQPMAVAPMHWRVRTVRLSVSGTAATGTMLLPVDVWLASTTGNTAAARAIAW